MKKILNTTQKFIPISMVLLSALAIYKGNTDIAIYLVLVALYEVLHTVNITVLIPEKEDKENE